MAFEATVGHLVPDAVVGVDASAVGFAAVLEGGKCGQSDSVDVAAEAGTSTTGAPRGVSILMARAPATGLYRETFELLSVRGVVEAPQWTRRNDKKKEKQRCE